MRCLQQQQQQQQQPQRGLGGQSACLPPAGALLLLLPPRGRHPHPHLRHVPRAPWQPARHPAPRLDAASDHGARADHATGFSIAGAAAWLDALYRFSRPHTMLGTTVSIVSVSCLAMHGFPWTAAAAGAVLQALAAALLMNVAIVGLNQVFDVDIDRVNKPYLPLASGEFSVATGVALVVGTAAASLALGAAAGSPPLMATLVLSLGLGVLYSMDLPFMRWKRVPWLAAGCILAVRALGVQLGFYYHMRWAALGTAQIAPSPPLLFTVGFMGLFSVVIALFKDTPDVKGDAEAGVATFSVRHGVRPVYWTCVALLLAAYVCGAAFGLARCEPAWRAALVAAGHLGLAGLLWRRSARVNLAHKQELTAHYMFIWKLFYAEYLLIPFLQ